MPVYFIQAETGHIKIGYATDVARRLAEVNTTSPVACKCLGVMPGGPPEERALHINFAPIRFRNEWFLPTPGLLEFIASNAAPLQRPVRAMPTPINRIGEVRVHLGLSQKQMADLLGTTQATVSRWERGLHHPNSRDLLALQTIVESRGAAA